MNPTAPGSVARPSGHQLPVAIAVTNGVFTLRQRELDWLYQGGAGAIFPERFQEFMAPVAPEDRGDPMAAYERLLNDPDLAVHGPAAVAWSV